MNKLTTFTTHLLIPVIFLMLIFARGASAGTTWYVNNSTGVDTLNSDQGTTPDKPFKTIQYGIDTASGGDYRGSC